MLRSPAKRLNAILLAWISAAMVTSVITTLIVFAYLAFLLVSGIEKGSGEPLDAVLSIGFILLLAMYAGVFSIFVALFSFGIGLAIFSTPAWWALHRLKLTNRVAFIITGAVLSVAGGAVTQSEFVLYTPLLAIPGGVAGWLIWRLGYEKP